MRRHRHSNAVAWMIGTLVSQGTAAQVAGTLQSLESSSSPQMCTAVRTNGASAADRLNAIANDVSVKTKAAIDTANTQNALRLCVSALSNMQQGADAQLRNTAASSLLDKIVAKACQVADQEVMSEVQSLRSHLNVPGGYFGIQGVTSPVGVVSVNTQVSGSYSASCVWDWLNSLSTQCH